MSHGHQEGLFQSRFLCSVTQAHLLRTNEELTLLEFFFRTLETPVNSDSGRQIQLRHVRR